MKGSLNPKLKKIEDIIIKGKYEQAHSQLNHYLEKEDISIEDYINCKILKTRIYYLTQPYSLALENGKEALKKSIEINNNYLIFDSAIWLTWIYGLTGKINNCKEMAGIAEQAINSISNKTGFEYLRRKSFYLRSRNSYSAGYDAIFEDLVEALKIAEKINDDYEIGCCLGSLGNLHSFFDKNQEALSYYQQSLDVAERTGDIETRMGSQANISDILVLKGELDDAFVYKINALELAEEMNSPFIKGILMYDLGYYYWHKGDMESAINCYEESKKLLELAQNTIHWHYSEVLYHLTVISLELDNTEKALEYQEILRSICSNHEENHLSHRFFNLVKAMIIKHQFTKGEITDISRLAEIEKKLESLSFEKMSFAEINKKALFHLCDLYVKEYYISKDLFFFEKLKHAISRFSKIAEEQKSSVLYAEVLLFESQLALIDYNTTTARFLLDKAQRIADEHGITKLGILISNTHDNLVDQLELWENTTNQLPDILDRMELTSLEELLSKLVKDKISYEDVIQEEEKPSIFLIMNQADSILFSEIFETSPSNKELLNTITEKILSIKPMKIVSDDFIDRTKINGHNAVFQNLNEVKFCYIFLGKSYSAINKFKSLLKDYNGSTKVWANLKEVILEQKNIELKDRINLSVYLQNVFT